MSYHLLNIETNDYFYCDDHEWLTAIDTAQRNGWIPDGTVFDIDYVSADQSFDVDDPLCYFFMLVTFKDEAAEWDGNYIEKRNQIVLYEDSIYLAMDLNGDGISDELVEFVKKGSFRICSE